MIHSVNLERFDQFLSKVRLVWSTLSFVTSGQETILKMREKKKTCQCALFFEEFFKFALFDKVTKNVHENQYSTWAS